jgi:hypothetical protein
MAAIRDGLFEFMGGRLAPASQAGKSRHDRRPHPEDHEHAANAAFKRVVNAAE